MLGIVHIKCRQIQSKSHVRTLPSIASLIHFLMLYCVFFFLQKFKIGQLIEEVESMFNHCTLHEKNKIHFAQTSKKSYGLDRGF